MPSNRRGEDPMFGIILVCSLAVTLGAGLYFQTVKKSLIPIASAKLREITTKFDMAALMPKPSPPKPIVKKEPVPQAVPEKISDAPIDLTHNPVLGQKLDDPTAEQPKGNAPVVRRVYGVRRVFSTGFGAGGAVSDAIIGKYGNTLNAPVDTTTATAKELKGTLVAVTTVTNAPSIITTVKPEYTKEMIDAAVSGVVKAELLIDSDGRVKDVRILNDLGYGTKERAIEAFRKWVFSPALRGKEPVAVWISYSIRFVLLQ